MTNNHVSSYFSVGNSVVVQQFMYLINFMILTEFIHSSFAGLLHKH